ncbi:MAG TPA: hypothetical protein VGD54_02430 [Steroidobacteraceae bacterium]
MLTLKTWLLASAATLTLYSSTIAEETPSKSIYTGGEKGAYHTLFCPPLPSALSNAYFQGYRCTASRGTLENIDHVLKEPTNIGFVQLDVFAAEAARRRDEFSKVTVIRQDIACEGLWMVTKNPDLDNYGHVLGLVHRIPFILPAQGSGSAASFAFLQANDPEGLGRVPEASKSFVADATATINEVAASTNGAVGFFVQFADPDNTNFKLILEKGLKVIPVASREILRIKLNGQSVYQLQAFDLKARGVFIKALEATTACTPVAIITGSPEAFDGDRNKIDDQRDLIERIHKIPADRLLPQEARIASIISSARKLSGQAVEEMQALIETTRQMIDNRNK